MAAALRSCRRAAALAALSSRLLPPTAAAPLVARGVPAFASRALSSQTFERSAELPRAELPSDPETQILRLALGRVGEHGCV